MCRCELVAMGYCKIGRCLCDLLGFYFEHQRNACNRDYELLNECTLYSFTFDRKYLMSCTCKSLVTPRALY